MKDKFIIKFFFFGWDHQGNSRSREVGEARYGKRSIECQGGVKGRRNPNWYTERNQSSHSSYDTTRSRLGPEFFGRTKMNTGTWRLFVHCTLRARPTRVLFSPSGHLASIGVGWGRLGLDLHGLTWVGVSRMGAKTSLFATNKIRWSNPR